MGNTLSDKFEKYSALFDDIREGNVNLFLGAGASLGARNENGPIMTTQELTKKLSDSIGLTNSLELSVVSTIVRSKKGDQWLKESLNTWFFHSEPTSWQINLASLPWRRVYTTNIDDVFTNALIQAKRKKLTDRRHNKYNGLCEYVNNDVREDKLDIIHLHGIADGQASVVLSKSEYATLSSAKNPWMNQFATDYLTKPFVFIGYSIADSDILHYIFERERSSGTHIHSSPRSYAISPTNAELFQETLSPLNIVCIESTGEEFANSILSSIGSISLKKNTKFSLMPFVGEASTLLKHGTEATIIFDRLFIPVRKLLSEAESNDQKSTFLLGSEPEWADIIKNIDAPRDLHDKIVEAVTSEGTHQLIIGAAGQGKTTLMMRIAKTLDERNIPCFWHDSNSPPNIEFVTRMIAAYSGKRFVLLTDRISSHKDLWLDLIRKSESSQFTLIGSDRITKAWDYIHFFEEQGTKKNELGRLSHNEIVGVIRVLDVHGMLGVLQGMPHTEQINQFEQKSQKELIVALKEATRGIKFDLILKDEYQELEHTGIKQAYLCVALVHMFGISLSEGILHSALETTETRLNQSEKEKLTHLLRFNKTKGTLSTRHPVIAELTVKQFATGPEIRDILIAIVKSIIPRINTKKKGAKNQEFTIFKQLINKEKLEELFRKDKALIEEVFDELKTACKHQPHFWLQYGIFTVNKGDLDLAENYLMQSMKLKYLEFTEHQLGLVSLLRAVDADTVEIAKQHYKDGLERMKKVIDGHYSNPAYPYTTLMSVSKNIIRKWGGKVVSIQEVQQIASDAYRLSSFRENQKIQKAWKELMEELQRAGS